MDGESIMWRAPLSVVNRSPCPLFSLALGWGWSLRLPSHGDAWVTAIATAALTYFAWTEALRHKAEDEAREAGMQHRLESVARLARRSCDATVASDAYYAMGREWARAVRFEPLSTAVP